MRSDHSGNDGYNFFKPVFFYVSVGFIQIREGSCLMEIFRVVLGGFQ